jgi:sarcosine oxidase subunit alpha
MNPATASGPAAGCLTDPARPLTFTFGDRAVAACAGQCIAAALYAAGVRVFSRSFKYHRPRGLFCVAGDCPNCLMQVDGRPNVRTCVEPARQGQVVVHQNAWPSLDCDVLRVFDRLDRFLPVGFYYKHFHRPAWLWPVFEHTVRHVAGLGRVDVDAAPQVGAEVEHVHAEVCVVGGGPAGLAAAVSAAEAGAGVVLLERRPLLGGRLLYAGDSHGELGPLRAAAEGHARIRVLAGTTAFGLYEGNLLGAFQGDRFLKVRARQVVVCTGGRQRPFVFHNNDLPGVFLGDGVLRLARLDGVRAGRRAVILTDCDEGAHLAAQLAALGIEVAAVVDRRGRKGTEAPKKKRKGKRAPAASGENWPTLASSVVLAARGDTRLKGVRVAQVKAGGALVAGSEQDLACDLLCVASAPLPANELLLQGGVRFRFDRGRWFPDRTVPGLLAAGLAAGTWEPDRQILEGRLRGAEAAAALGHRSSALDVHRRAWEGRRGSTLFLNADSILPGGPEGGHKRFVCLCEDVTEKDLEQAVAEGFDGIETLKRYSTVNMGPCQGKVCGQAAVEVCARATGREVNAVGTTTSRPPAVPVELGVLAAERRRQPVRRTPLHHGHEAAGARWLDAGLWKRPESYGDPSGEVRAVRSGVGLIDVSTLGKIEVLGPGAVELLERVYLNRWADLRPGRARYGALCNEDGILFDDGVGACLGPDRFYLTATTGNADAVAQWLELWRDTWRLNAAVLNHTGAAAAMNLAGPRAREVLGRLTALDVSAEAFPYMAMRESLVAGVPCRLFRIGFVGELGYEIHCPASQAWHLWEALLGAGADFGLRPFGVEAQRILRLEKGHPIIGQDTDALSNPLEAGLGWLVRFDKPSFHGREPLLRLREMGARSRLVGFHFGDRDRVPAEGCQVIEGQRPVGRVTSARYSPTLGRSLGLAWLPASRAAVGERFTIRWNDGDHPAVVARLPFYDPGGRRLRS